MIEIKVLVDDVDYDSIANMLLPVISEQMENGDAAPWMKLLFVSQGLNQSTVSKILSRMPQDKKDAMLIKYINKNRDKIGDMLVQFARSNGVKMDIRNVDARQV